MTELNFKEIKKAYLRRGFGFDYFSDIESATEFINKLIPESSVIGFGGSMTVKEIKLLENLPNRTLLHRDIVKEDPQALMLKMHTADWYISSANALTVNGDIINIDGRGNRVGEIVNGPENVLIIVGSNKFVNTIDEGIERTRNVASPPNCVRLNKKTPCAVTGKCSHCNSPDTICRATLILHHPTTGKKVHIVAIDKKLGF